MSQYINEAFKQFRMLNESEDFSLDPMGLDNLNSFMDRAMEDEDDDLEIDIIDPETTEQDELKQSYIGKVICDCNVCHSNVFYNKEDITVDEDGVVNVEDECPYCMSNDGYTIVGEIKPYEEISIEDIDEPETDEPIEGEQDTILNVKYDMEEGLQLSGEKELKGTSDLRHRDDKEGSDKIRGKNNTKLSGDKDLHESIELGDDGQTIWSGVSVREDSIANNPHTTNRMIWTDDDEEGYIEYLVRLGIPDEQLCHEFYTRGWNGKDALEEYKKSDLSLHESVRRFENDEHIYGVIFDDGSEIKLPGTSKEEIARLCKSEKDRKPIRIIDLGPNDIFVRGKGNRIERINPQEVVFKESIENVSIDTEDETMTMTTKEDGGVVVETSPTEEEIIDEPVSDDEMIAPLDDETVDELGLEDETPEEDTFDFDETESEEEPDEDTEDVDIDEFDEDSFDDLGESYLRRCYENVNGFRTTKVTCNESQIMVEGNISFKSGNVKKTNFIFEAKEVNNGKYIFEGYNDQINIRKNAYRLNCSLDNKKLISESLTYNYSSKNELNESVKVSGTVRSQRGNK